jgi:tetratricopeptide (TPR) repeat protein
VASSEGKKGLSRRDLLFGGFRKLRETSQERLEASNTRQSEQFTTPADNTTTPQQDVKHGRAAFLRAGEAYAASDYETAIPEYRECIKRLPHHSEARQRLGYCLYRTGQYVQAKVEFDRVLRDLGKDNFSSLYLGLTLAHLGKREQTVTAWRGYFNAGEVRIMRELNVQTALIESSEDYELSEAAEAVEDAIAIRKEELLSESAQ